MKMVAFEVEAWEREAFAPLAGEHELVLLAAPLGPESAGAYGDAEIVSTFIYSDVHRATLDRLPKLRLVATRSTGFDHIDVGACRERGVTVCNVPRYGETTVAEHVFGLLLTLSHHLDQAIDRTRKGDFSPKGLTGFDLFGKTMGVVGAGGIGRCVVRIARGFGMHVVAFDTRHDEALAEAMGFSYLDVDALLEVSDVVTLHVPSTPKTHHLLDWERFQRMKRGAVLINTARGDLVDTRALVRALAEGRLAGAGLDVLAEEPTVREEAELMRSVYERTHNLSDLLADHVLLRLRNVVVTPHSAFDTREARRRIVETTIENVRAFAAGEAENVVA